MECVQLDMAGQDTAIWIKTDFFRKQHTEWVLDYNNITATKSILTEQHILKNHNN